MARSYKVYAPFNVAMKLLIPTSTVVKGQTKKVFPNPDDAPLFMASFRTFGGTESRENELYTIIDTATIDTWYRPDITADCRVYVCETQRVYEVIGTPENIDMRHQYLHFKVRAIGGKA